MEASKNKKDSIFFGIFPSSEPAPPIQAPQTHKPAVSEEYVGLLNKKIEQLERQLEKELAEQAPPPPPSSLAPAVLSKITEMESRLKDFQEKFLLGASQLKNIEESKISGRREIEELLKAVREQQKYTELDRQMHDQLEKAWLRVEEMEKRMMEVYSAAAKKPPEPPARTVSPAEIAAEVLKAVDARLEERMKPLVASLNPAAARTEVQKGVDAGLDERLATLEALLKNAAAMTEIAATASRAMERRIAELSVIVDARFAGFSSEIRQLHIEAFAGKERVADILAEVKRDVLSSLREGFADKAGTYIRHVDATAIDVRERLDAVTKLLISHMNEIDARDRENALKVDELEAHLRLENEKALSVVASMQYGIEKTLCAHVDAVAARAAEENYGQLEKIKEAYGLAASYAPAVASLAGTIFEIEGRLVGTLDGLKAFIKALEPVNLEAVLGVSGAIIRRSFESAAALVAELEKETVSLTRAKSEIDVNLKNMAPKTAGEAK